MTETKKRKMSAAQRRARKRKIRNRRIAMTVALVLVVALVSVGGTIAWLTATTTPVTNTFTSADVAIALTETKQSDGSTKDTSTAWTAKMVPGAEYTKNPVVSVESSTDIDVYLFVKFEEINNPQTYLTYTSTLTAAKGWTQGDGTNIPTNVWYRVVPVSGSTKSWHLLDGDKVTVKSDAVTKQTVAAASAAQLKYTAYACQYQGFETNAAGAWASVNPTT